MAAASKIIPFDVLNRFSGEVQFTAQIECSQDALPSVKLGLAVKWAVANRASLVGASLDGASLVGASLDGASLDRASLDGASLDRASLVGASLVGASLDRASLVGASLDGASLDRASLDGASLVVASLVGASLVRASLDGASLVRASLVGASLVRASLVGASLVGASLVRASLVGASLVGEALRPFKADLWLTLGEIGGPIEAQHLIAKLRAGQVDGGTYGKGTNCACLVGTIAAAHQKPGEELDHNPERPAERWFMMIKPGDIPGDETGGGFAAGKALEWTEQWCAAHGHPTEPDVQAVSA